MKNHVSKRCQKRNGGLQTTGHARTHTNTLLLTLTQLAESSFIILPELLLIIWLILKMPLCRSNGLKCYDTNPWAASAKQRGTSPSLKTEDEKNKTHVTWALMTRAGNDFSTKKRPQGRFESVNLTNLLGSFLVHMKVRDAGEIRKVRKQNSIGRRWWALTLYRRHQLVIT